jgi:hypothetical protein
MSQTPATPHEATTTNDELARAVPKDDAATAAAREKFLASLADPPDNVATEIRNASAEEDDAEDPKVPTGAGSVKPSTPSAKDTPRSSPASLTDPGAAVLAALKAGDLDAIADLTGADPADFDEKSTKWAARNRREAGLRKDIEKVKADAREILTHYEPIETQQEAFDRSGGKDWGPVRAIVEHVTGKPWHVAAAQLGLAVGSAPAAPSPAADRVLLEAIRDDVPDDHQVRQLPGWETRVLAILRENVDEVTGEPAISFRQAGARALRRAKEEHAKLTPIFGGAPEPAARRASAPERADLTAPSTKRKLTQEEFYARFDRAGK